MATVLEPSNASAEAGAAIAVRGTGLVKRFGDVAAVDHVDLEVRDGEFFSLLGPSGSGKTTMLRMIAGFELPDEGLIELAGRDVTRVPPFDRDVNTVFQDYALFPHMTVARERRVRPARPQGAARASGASAWTRRSRWCGSTGSAAASRTSSRAGSASASRSRARS